MDYGSTPLNRSTTARTPNIITELVAAVRDAAGDRNTIVVGENEPQRSSLVRPREEGGSALDALWNDDFHHAARVAATGRDEAYYSGYRGVAQEFVSAAKYGFLYQGQSYPWQEKAPRHPGARPSAHAVRGLHATITIRSRTRVAGGVCIKRRARVGIAR